MISYTLNCAAAHEFDSWFRSSAAFDALLEAGKLACPICGSADIRKSLMSPAVRPARKGAAPPAPDVAAKPDPAPPVAGTLSKPSSPIEQAFAAMRREVEANSDYVGLNFAA